MLKPVRMFDVMNSRALQTCIQCSHVMTKVNSDTNGALNDADKSHS